MSGLDIAVVGAGPAGLMAADVLAGQGAQVTVYDRMPSVGRKFLLAGRGGLNLTHSEDLERFLARYGVAAPRLRAAIEAFPPSAVRAWCEGLGQETFVGSSGRVFPKSFKTSPLLRAWLRRLDAAGVRFALRHHWIGWDERGGVQFEAPQGRVAIHPDALILALGGASWPRLGSDGGWIDVLATHGIAISPLRPANCGFVANWSADVPRPLPGPAAQAHRDVVRRAIGARRIHRHPRRSRRRRHLRAVGASARRHRGQRRGYARLSRCGPTFLRPNCSASSKPRAASNRWRTCCARR